MIKQLPNGGQAFYAIDWGARLIGIIWLLFCLNALVKFCCSPSENVYLLLPISICGIIGMVASYFGFFAPPLCTVYPERLVICTLSFFRRKQTTLFWDQIKQFYLKEVWIRRGKSSILTKALILDTSTGLTEVKMIYQINKKDRELLFRILAERGIPQGPEIKDSKLSDRWRKFFLKW